MSLRSWLYRAARWLGDLGSVKRGRVPRRVARRAAGNWIGRLLRRIFG